MQPGRGKEESDECQRLGLRPQTVLCVDTRPSVRSCRRRRCTQRRCPERTAGGNNGYGIQSKGRHAGNEGRKGQVEVLAAQVITTPKPLSNGKGQLIHSLLLY